MMKNSDLLVVNNNRTNKQTTLENYAVRNPNTSDLLLLQRGGKTDQWALPATKFAKNEFADDDLFLLQRESDLTAITGSSLKRIKPQQLQDSASIQIDSAAYSKKINGELQHTWKPNPAGGGAFPTVTILENNTTEVVFGTAFLPDDSVLYRAYKSEGNTYAFTGLRVAIIGSNGIRGGGKDVFQPLYMNGMPSNHSVRYAGKHGSYWYVASSPTSSKISIWRSSTVDFTSGVSRFDININDTSSEVAGMWRDKDGALWLCARGTGSYEFAWLFKSTNNGQNWTTESTIPTGPNSSNVKFEILKLTGNTDDRTCVQIRDRESVLYWDGSTWIDLNAPTRGSLEVCEGGDAGLFICQPSDGVFQLPQPFADLETRRWWNLCKADSWNSSSLNFSRIGNEIIHYYSNLDYSGGLFPTTTYYKQLLSSSVFIPS